MDAAMSSKGIGRRKRPFGADPRAARRIDLQVQR